MLIKICFTITILLQIGLSLTTKTEPSISECAAKGGECNESKGRPVCGTDNQTYPTLCHLIRAQCSGHPVSFKHRGACKEACVASRNYALNNRGSATNSVKFVPKCRADGSYAAVQCLLNVGCWCVNSQGKPQPNTTVKTGRPICLRNSKSNPRRSSNPSGNRRVCIKADRIKFNIALTKLFHLEHARYMIQNVQQKKPHSITDKMVLDWKFSVLDTNKNHMLDKNEYRELKRVIKQTIKPRRCSRGFGKFCDVDHDERLTRQEWSNCLSKDGPNPIDNTSDKMIGVGGKIGISTSNNMGYGTNDRDRDFSDNTDDIDDDDYLDNDDDSEELQDSENTLGGTSPIRTSDTRKHVLLLRGKSTFELHGDPDHGRENDGESDCKSDRSAALDDMKSGSQAYYVPECTGDGRYQRVQCYSSTGYCWCVHEDTGKNIPGTSTKDTTPQCDLLIQSRPMKGCDEEKKIEFLKELKEFLKAKIIIGADSTKWGTEDEKIATLSFVYLDKNKNKVWERKEWKTFRELVSNIKSLKKCGKKMPRYCDVNSDKKITLSEWLNCLQAQRRNPEHTERSIATAPRPQSTKLIGPNPLESFLKSD